MKYTAIDTFTMRSKLLNQIVFKLNSDDFHTEHIRKIRKITKHIKSLGYTVKTSRQYSKIKLMSWCKVTITTNKSIQWDENKKLAFEIVNDALN